MTDHRSRRWFQLSLKSLFLLTLVVGAFFAGFATPQKLANKAIQDARDKGAAEGRDAAVAELKAQQEAVYEEWAS